MLTSRLLPPDEWAKIASTPPYDQGLPDSDHWLIVVVEEDGEILASCAIFDTAHWDVFNIRPDQQKNPAVIRHLLDESLRTLQDRGVPSVHLTIPQDQPELTALAEHFGFVRSPFSLYACAIPPKVEDS